MIYALLAVVFLQPPTLVYMLNVNHREQSNRAVRERAALESRLMALVDPQAASMIPHVVQVGKAPEAVADVAYIDEQREFELQRSIPS